MGRKRKYLVHKIKTFFTKTSRVIQSAHKLKMVKVLTLCYITILVLKFGDLGFEKTNIHTQGTLKISGGDLNKFSNPGVRARNSARNSKLKSGVAESWSSNHAYSSLPIRAKYLGRQFQNKPEMYNKSEKRLSSRQTPYPVDSAHPQCGALSSKRNTETDRLMTTHGGVEIALSDQSSSHLTSGHGHDFEVYDALPIDVRQKTSIHKKVQTRIYKVNKDRFGDALENIVRDPTTRVFQDIVALLVKVT